MGNVFQAASGDLSINDHAHDVGLSFMIRELLTVDLDFGAGPFAEQDLVAGLDVDRDQAYRSRRDRRGRPRRFRLLGLLLAVSGMMMPPFVFSSPSRRRTTTRSCRGRNFMRFLIFL